MTPTLAKFIAEKFAVVAHKESGDVIGAGFDATVWRGLSGTPYAGKIYVSMQGTQGFADFLTDADLVASGAARQQIVDMVNWWYEITTPKGQPSRRITQVPATVPLFVDAAPGVGTGLLVGVRSVQVNGHSLGGHLATAFARLFGGTLTIEHVSTFNSAGFSPLSDLVFENLETLLGTGTGRYLSERQDNYFATHGINVTTNSFFNQQIGTRTRVFNEYSAWQVPNHSMYKLTDSLALANLLAQLDPTVAQEKVNLLFDSGATSADAALEGIVNGLRRLLLNPAAAGIPVGDASDADSRKKYHETLQQLQDNATLQSLKGKVFVETGSRSLGERARNEFGAMAPLISLSPLVLLGTGDALEKVFETTWGSTYQNWKQDRDAVAGSDKLNFTQQWIDDRAAMYGTLLLASQQRGAFHNDASLKEVWVYEDRSSGQLVTRQPPGAGPFAQHQVIFGGNVGESLAGGPLEDRLYGGAGNDTLDAGAKNDYLEGGVGLDIYRFAGRFGVDTLMDADGQGSLIIEGKTLSGTMQRVEGLSNTWQDSTGLCVMSWEEGEDHRGRLIIGRREAALDTHVRGVVVINGFANGELGLTLGSSERAVPALPGSYGNMQVYFSEPSDTSPFSGEPDVRLKDTRNYTDLSDRAHAVQAVEDGGQIVTLGNANDYVDVARGNYGISGKEWDPEPGEDEDYVSTAGGNDTVRTGYGSDYIDGGSGNDDIYSGAYGNFQFHDPADAASGDVVYAGEGDDRVFGAYGSDLIAGGDGNDQVMGQEGADLMSGGAGADTLYGDALYAINIDYPGAGVLLSFTTGGNDTVFADEGEDWLIGGTGGDELYGGDGRDRLYGDSNGYVDPDHRNMAWIPGEYHEADTLRGGAGADYLMGGGGGDVLFGGTGTDVIRGDQAEDARAAIVLAYHGSDFIDGGDDGDWLYGEGGADTIEGGAGYDELYGGLGNDLLSGGQDNDTLEGAEGNDTLIADAGEDRLNGGEGNDTFIVQAGAKATIDGSDGKDIIIVDGGEVVLSSITTTASADLIRLTGVKSLADVQLLRHDFVSAQTVTAVGNDGHRAFRITFRPFIDASGTPKDALSGIEFEGGVWSASQIRAMVQGTASEGSDTLYGFNDSADTLVGLGGDDTLEGQSGNDTYDGGAGNDRLQDDSTSSNDTYRFGLGGGYDVINDHGGNDRLELGTGITPAMVSIRADWGFLTLHIGANDDILLTVYDTTRGTFKPEVIIESIVFADGTKWDFERIKKEAMRGTAGADTLSGFADNDTIDSRDGDDDVMGLDGHDSLNGGAGNDTINGGAGSDTLRGGAGDDMLLCVSGGDLLNGEAGNDSLGLGSGEDRVRFTAGGGSDSIGGFDGNADHIEFGAGLDKLKMSISRDGVLGDVRFAFTTGEKLTLVMFVNRYDGSIGALGSKAIQFSDGQTYTAAELRAELLRQATTTTSAADTRYLLDGNESVDGGAGNDTLFGLGGNDSIAGGLGYDSLNGGFGHDVLSGGLGNDVLQGEDGNDTLSGGDGNDRLLAGFGDDVLDGGAGNDELHSDGGTDIYMFGRGDGQDGIGRERVQGAYGASLKLKAGIAPSEILLKRVADISGGTSALEVSIVGTSDKVTIDRFFDSDWPYVKQIVFASGERWDVKQMQTVVNAGGKVAAIGGTSANDSLTGTAAAERMYGLAGADTLDGKAGADTLGGGAGNDSYVVDHIADQIYEAASEGVDTVRSSISHTLAANVENVTLTGTAAINAMGNALDNTLKGNTGANVLSGGAGNDIYYGGAGNDSFVDSSTTSSDTYKWGAGHGTDTLADAGGAMDHVDLLAGITKSQLQFARSGNHLQLSLDGYTDTLTVSGWFTSANNRIEEFRMSDGSKVLATEVQLLIQAMAAFSAPDSSVAAITSSSAKTHEVWPGGSLLTSPIA